MEDKCLQGRNAVGPVCTYLNHSALGVAVMEYHRNRDLAHVLLHQHHSTHGRSYDFSADLVGKDLCWAILPMTLQTELFDADCRRNIRLGVVVVEPQQGGEEVEGCSNRLLPS